MGLAHLANADALTTTSRSRARRTLQPEAVRVSPVLLVAPLVVHAQLAVETAAANAAPELLCAL